MKLIHTFTNTYIHTVSSAQCDAKRIRHSQLLLPPHSSARLTCVSQMAASSRRPWQAASAFSQSSSEKPSRCSCRNGAVTRVNTSHFSEETIRNRDMFTYTPRNKLRSGRFGYNYVKMPNWDTECPIIPVAYNYSLAHVFAVYPRPDRPSRRVSVPCKLTGCAERRPPAAGAAPVCLGRLSMTYWGKL